MTPITVKLTTKNDCYVNQFMTTCKGIVVHSTATPGVSAAQFNESWNKPLAPNKKSVHYFVDDAAIIQCLEVAKTKTRKAGHVGTGTSGNSANTTHVAFEICEPSTNKYNASWQLTNTAAASKTYFDKAYNNAVDLCVTLCKLYGFTEKAIISHAEAYKQGIGSNHGDPDTWFKHQGTSMDKFRAEVAKRLSGTVTPSATEITPTVYIINTSSAPLNVRATADTNGTLLGTFAKGAYVTATKKSGDWLYVTNGSLTGWASAQYLKVVTGNDAVNTLASRKVITSPDYWNEQLPKVKYLPDMFIKWVRYGGVGKKYGTGAEAINALAAKGYITSPDYWKEQCKSVKYLSDMFIKWATSV